MKERIENLQRRLEAQGHHANGLMEVRVDDVRAAIELMNAAEPKDEVAERERCRAALLVLYGDGCTEIEQSEIDWARAFAAQARAERHVEICVLRVDVDAWKRRAEAAQAELSAQARLSDIQILEHAVAAQAGRAREAETTLSAAQAEIDWLRNANAAVHKQWSYQATARDSLETKLTNLRAAAERAALRLLTTNQHETTGKAVAKEIEAAVEESR